jgi:hypothetical protein
MKQILTVCPDGALAGLTVSGGFNYLKLGKASVQRVTEILWDEENQKWYGKFLRGPLSGTKLLGGKLFDEYADAVSAEVDAIHGLMARGCGDMVGL